MSIRPYVISGEAHESESDEDINVLESFNSYQAECCTGKVVSGEATESDEDFLENINPSSNNNITPVLPKFSTKKEAKKNSSILIKKLIEKNISLKKNLNYLISQTSFNIFTELNTINQRLLKCQVQLQQGKELLKLIKLNLNVLDSNLKSILSINYLPPIKIGNDLKKGNEFLF